MNQTAAINEIGTGFSDETKQILHEIYQEQTAQVLEALKTPGETFSIRVNSLKTTREEVLQRLAADGLEPEAHGEIEEVILLPVHGPNQLPEGEFQELMVDKNAAEAILRGSDLYAPGVKACHGIRSGELTVIIAPNGEPVAVGRAMMSETEILDSRKGLAVKVEQSKYGLPSFHDSELFREGHIYPQTIPSILVSRNLLPDREETIVDMNAAPGGKTTHLAQLVQNKARILAFDRHAEKVDKLRENTERMGAECVEPRVADSRYLDKDFPTLKADAVLVDPPCSALGVRPKIYDTTSRRKISVVADYQRQFLEAAARILKPDGRIIYSICTMTFQECEKQVASLCEKYHLCVEGQEFMLGSLGFGQISQGSECQRFHPHIHDTPGFFIALLHKTRR